MLLLGGLFAASALVVYATREPPELVLVKEKYRKLREHLRDTENTKYRMLWTAKPITGFHRMGDSVGHNTSKGAEIAVCLDGNENQIFHVLLHELAHCTVAEYSHSKEFWSNYAELRDIAIHIGIYDRIPKKQKFCGQHVQDK